MRIMNTIEKQTGIIYLSEKQLSTNLKNIHMNILQILKNTLCLRVGNAPYDMELFHMELNTIQMKMRNYTRIIFKDTLYVSESLLLTSEDEIYLNDLLFYVDTLDKTIFDYENFNHDTISQKYSLLLKMISSEKFKDSLEIPISQ